MSKSAGRFVRNVKLVIRVDRQVAEASVTRFLGELGQKASTLRLAASVRGLVVEIALDGRGDGAAVADSGNDGFSSQRCWSAQRRDGPNPGAHFKSTA